MVLEMTVLEEAVVTGAMQVMPVPRATLLQQLLVVTRGVTAAVMLGRSHKASAMLLVSEM